MVWKIAAVYSYNRVKFGDFKLFMIAFNLENCGPVTAVRILYREHKI